MSVGPAGAHLSKNACQISCVLQLFGISWHHFLQKDGPILLHFSRKREFWQVREVYPAPQISPCWASPQLMVKPSRWADVTDWVSAEKQIRTSCGLMNLLLMHGRRIVDFQKWMIENSSTKWVFPKIMVSPNHPFVHRVFHYFHHPFWGVNTPIFGNIQIWPTLWPFGKASFMWFHVDKGVINVPFYIFPTGGFFVKLCPVSIYGWISFRIWYNIYKDNIYLLRVFLSFIIHAQGVFLLQLEYLTFALSVGSALFSRLQFSRVWSGWHSEENRRMWCASGGKGKPTVHGIFAYVYIYIYLYYIYYIYIIYIC